MGLGGGFVLLLYLVFTGGEQFASQGQNLLFFMAVCAVGLIFHIKNRLVDARAAVICGACGLPFVCLGFYLATLLPDGTLQKISEELL